MGMLFDGVDDFVRIPDFVDVGNSNKEISVFIWVNGPENADEGVFGHYDFRINQRAWAIVASSSGSADKFRCLVNDDGSDGVGHWKSYESSITVFDNMPHLIGFTFNSGTLKPYADGIEDTSVNKINDAAITTIHNSTADITIGCYLDNDTINPAWAFSGQLNEAIIYPGVLTDIEIADLYNSRMKRRAQQFGYSTLRYWPMNDGADGTSANGDTVRDLSNNGNDGIGTGGIWKAEEVLGYSRGIIIPNSVGIPGILSNGLMTPMHRHW